MFEVKKFGGSFINMPRYWKDLKSILLQKCPFNRECCYSADGHPQHKGLHPISYDISEGLLQGELFSEPWVGRFCYVIDITYT